MVQRGILRRNVLTMTTRHKNSQKAKRLDCNQEAAQIVAAITGEPVPTGLLRKVLKRQRKKLIPKPTGKRYSSVKAMMKDIGT